jgi:hypothetical protein
MSSFSIDGVWEETIAFLRRESGLILPLAMATFGLGTIMLGFTTQSGQPASGAAAVAMSPRILWFIPAMLLTVLGNMAISLLVLRPQSTVGESLRTAVGRIPVAIGIGMLAALAGFVLFIVAVLFATLVGVLWPAGQALRLNGVVVLITLPLLWLTIRLLVMWPLVADGALGPVATLRRSFALTRGHAFRAFLVIMIFGALYVSLISISQIALLPVTRLLGMATGQPELLKLVSDLVTAFIGSVLMMGWTVYVAFTYLRLSA